MNTLFKFIIGGIALVGIASLIQNQFSMPDGVTGITTLSTDIDQLEAALTEAKWVSPGTSDTAALYQVSFRTCPPCIAYHEEQFPKLTDNGVDTRLLSFARRKTVSDAEKATLADVYAGRDWALSAKWWAKSSPSEFYAANYSDAKATDEIELAVAQGKASVDALRDVLKANGVKMAFPTHIWQNADGEWRVNVGYSPSSSKVILNELSER